jgi:hypothetical protein
MVLRLYEELLSLEILKYSIDTGVTTMPAYCFFDVLEVSDTEKMEQCRSGVLKTVELYGGRYLPVGGKCDIVEGKWYSGQHPTRSEGRRTPLPG